MAGLKKLKNRFRHWRLKTRLSRPVIRIERKINHGDPQKVYVPAGSARRRK